jgi:hypothetical protein
MSNATLQTIPYPWLIGLGFVGLFRGYVLKFKTKYYCHMFKYQI